MGFLLLCCSNSQVKPQFQPDVEDPHQMLQDFPDAPIVMQCGAPSSACPDVSRLPGVAFYPRPKLHEEGLHQMFLNFPDAPIIMQRSAHSTARPDVSRLPGVFSPRSLSVKTF